MNVNLKPPDWYSQNSNNRVKNRPISKKQGGRLYKGSVERKKEAFFKQFYKSEVDLKNLGEKKKKELEVKKILAREEKKGKRIRLIDFDLQFAKNLHQKQHKGYKKQQKMLKSNRKKLFTKLSKKRKNSFEKVWNQRESKFKEILEDDSKIYEDEIHLQKKEKEQMKKAQIFTKEYVLEDTDYDYIKKYKRNLFFKQCQGKCQGILDVLSLDERALRRVFLFCRPSFIYKTVSHISKGFYFFANENKLWRKICLISFHITRKIFEKERGQPFYYKKNFFMLNRKYYTFLDCLPESERQEGEDKRKKKVV